MIEKVLLSPPHMSGNELKYIERAFKLNYIAPIGENVDLFENSIKNYSGTSSVLATNSGTAAIHLALILAGVGPGDFVICQSFTFVGSANPIKYLGATPIFVDSEKDTWNMDPIALEQAILSAMNGELDNHSDLCEIKNLKPQKPKAILPVHLYGMPAKMEEILRISEKYGIPVIEDAAEALGSSIKGQRCGTFGDMGIYSFNGNKIITTSGGGALVSHEKKYIDEARCLSAQARDNFAHYEHSKIGYNYRLSNIAAGIGIAQMEVIEDRVERRRANFDLYQQYLEEENSISFQKEPHDYKSNRWLTTILIQDGSEQKREDLRKSLEFLGIETRPLWKPMHLQPIFRGYPYFGSGLSEQLFKTGLCLPSGSSLPEETIAMISTKIKQLTKKQVYTFA